MKSAYAGRAKLEITEKAFIQLKALDKLVIMMALMDR